MRNYLILSMCLILLMLQSCGMGQKSIDEQPIIDSIDVLNVDTIVTPVDTVLVDTLPPRRYFNTPDAAKAFVRSEEYRNTYANSIIPQMIEDHFPYAQKLLNNKYNRFIVVDKYKMKVMLFDRWGRLDSAYTMACGKNYGTKHEKADSRTPEGFFTVEGIYDSTDWLFVDDDGVESKIKGQFGPRFIRLRIPETSQIGIHGTCSPRSLGWRCSHGCIRITNEQILGLVELVEPGMPVIVNPGVKDTRTNLEEGYDIPWISTTPGKPRYKEPKYTLKVPVDTTVNDSLLITPITVDTVSTIEVPVDIPKPSTIPDTIPMMAI